MTFKEAKVLARQGVKMKHEYFAYDEYITIHGNVVIFEDGVEIFVDEWLKRKDYLLIGWEKFQKQ